MNEETMKDMKDLSEFFDVQKVEAVATTKPIGKLKDEGFEDARDLIAYCARVSNPSNQMNKETNEKLVRYLMNHKHWSPFEMVDVVMEITTTRDIARQALRHRSFMFQEFSQRYADPTQLDQAFVLREARLQDQKNRQNSIEVDDPELQATWRRMQAGLIEHAKGVYQWAIEHGIAKEQARAVLPEGNTISRLYMKGSVRSWIHYIDLRAANGTQLEHMMLAREIAYAISDIFPLSPDYFNKG